MNQISSQLYNLFGNPTPDPDKSHIIFSLSQFHFGQNAQIRIKTDLRNAGNHRISAASCESLQQLILLRINRSPVPMIQGSIIGSLFAAFPPTQEVQIEIYLMDKLIISQICYPTDSFQPSTKAQISGNKITALSTSTFYSARTLLNGVGEFQISCQEIALCGVCLVSQRHVLFGAQIFGKVRLVSDGKKLEMYFRDDKRVIEGLDNEEVVLFIKLKAGRSAELLPIKQSVQVEETSTSQ